MRILVIEDDAALAEALADSLRAQNWQADCCGDGEEGLYLARMDAYDVLLVDRMLPGMDGTELVRCLRREGHMVPVLMMTALDAVGDRVAGLDAGADDYLPKPFATAELLARVRALARRPAALQTSAALVGDVRLDTVQRRLQGPAGSADCPGASVRCWGYWPRIWSAPSRGKRCSCACGAPTAMWKTAISTTMRTWCADGCPALEVSFAWSPSAGWDTA